MELSYQNYDKAAIKNYLLNVLMGKIKTLEFYTNFPRDATKDLKKTAKYDSFREEMQEEIYHLQRQMHHLKTMQHLLRKLPLHRKDVATSGALVITDKARFYISVGMGEFFFENDRFYAISAESPMAKIFENRHEGDTISLNNITQTITKIF